MKKLIEIKNLHKNFPIRAGFFNKQVGAVYAVNDVTLDIFKGETLGLVGESGCGKSTLGRCIINLIDSTSGSILYNGEEIANAKGKTLKNLRKKMQIIFQNPFSSLNPRMTIGEIIKEPLKISRYGSNVEINNRIDELVETVGLTKEYLNRYPHEFSGGQRQRIGIARALAMKPEFIIADEPVSALDVSIQAQIINLLQKLKKDLGLTYLFISHDLSVIKYISDRVAVMYLGEIVEVSRTRELFKEPKHPYTQALLSAIPLPEVQKRTDRIVLKGDLPSPANPPSGCKFHTRCPYAMPICTDVNPDKTIISESHYARCHLLTMND